MLDYVVVKKESYTFVKGMARGGGGVGLLQRGFESSSPYIPYVCLNLLFE